ncbi:unnamed protein product [Amoebophrya sp. A120]|nr:unnamed protein product [Amoebophrya sp. A120]|eukprot:GSA120T00021337001.1
MSLYQTSSVGNNGDPPGGSASDVRVVVRIRPPSHLGSLGLQPGYTQTPSGSVQSQESVCFFAQEDNKLAYKIDPYGVSPLCEEAQFDHVLDFSCKNEEMYEQLKLNDCVTSCMQGFAETIFAYGQTGSGKSYTILGHLGGGGGAAGASTSAAGEVAEYDFSKDFLLNSNSSNADAGILPRCTKTLFEKLAALTDGRRRTVQLTAVEVKDSQVTDLLELGGGSSGSIGANLRTPRQVGAQMSTLDYDRVPVKGKLSYYRKATVWSYEETMRHLRYAIDSREVGTSSLNSESSRSHMVIRFFVKSYLPDGVTCGTLTLVDLAGSEKEHENPTRSGQTEASGINVSLTHLNRLLVKMQFNQLDDSDKRQSTLNMVLFDSLKEDCGVTMVFCIHPDRSTYQASKTSLQMAQRCKKIQRKKRIRRLVRVSSSSGNGGSALISEMDQKIAELRQSEIQETQQLRKKQVFLEKERSEDRMLIDSLERKNICLQQMVEEHAQIKTHLIEKAEQMKIDYEKRIREMEQELAVCKTELREYKNGVPPGGSIFTNNINNPASTSKTSHLLAANPKGGGLHRGATRTREDVEPDLCTSGSTPKDEQDPVVVDEKNPIKLPSASQSSSKLSTKSGTEKSSTSSVEQGAFSGGRSAATGAATAGGRSGSYNYNIQQQDQGATFAPLSRRSGAAGASGSREGGTSSASGNAYNPGGAPSEMISNGNFAATYSSVLAGMQRSLGNETVQLQGLRALLKLVSASPGANAGIDSSSSSSGSTTGHDAGERDLQDRHGVPTRKGGPVEAIKTRSACAELLNAEYGLSVHQDDEEQNGFFPSSTSDGFYLAEYNAGTSAGATASGGTTSSRARQQAAGGSTIVKPMQETDTVMQVIHTTIQALRCFPLVAKIQRDGALLLAEICSSARGTWEGVEVELHGKTAVISSPKVLILQEVERTILPMFDKKELFGNGGGVLANLPIPENQNWASSGNLQNGGSASLASSFSSQYQQVCVAASRLLAVLGQREPELQTEIGQLGAIEKIVGAMMLFDREQQEEGNILSQQKLDLIVHGCWSLMNLCNKHAENQAVFRELGGIDILLHLVAEVSEFLAAELSGGRSGGVDRTVKRHKDGEVVKHDQQDHNHITLDEDDVLLQCKNAGAYLSGCIASVVESCAENQAEFFRSEGMEHLVTLLSCGLDSAGIVSNVCIAIAHACHKNKNANPQHQTPLFKLVLEALKSFHPEHGAVVGNACRCVATLTESSFALGNAASPSPTRGGPLANSHGKPGASRTSEQAESAELLTNVFPELIFTLIKIMKRFSHDTTLNTTIFWALGNLVCKTQKSLMSAPSASSASARMFKQAPVYIQEPDLAYFASLLQKVCHKREQQEGPNLNQQQGDSRNKETGAIKEQAGSSSSSGAGGLDPLHQLDRFVEYCCRLLSELTKGPASSSEKCPTAIRETRVLMKRNTEFVQLLVKLREKYTNSDSPPRPNSKAVLVLPRIKELYQNLTK